MHVGFNNNTRNKMPISDNTKISIIILFGLSLSILFQIILIINLEGFFTATVINDRDLVTFHEDIYIDIPESESKLLITEYDIFFKSGAYIVRIRADKTETLIGRIETKNGFRPFDRNQYRLEFRDGGVFIEWAEINDADSWKSKFLKFSLIN